MPRTPKEVPLTKYEFRVDEVEGVNRDGVIRFLRKQGCRHVVAFEISTERAKPHYQGWVELTVSQDTWRDRIKAAFPVKGSQYSAAVVNKATYDRYILKGTRESPPDIVSMQLCPGETLDVEREWREFWAVNDELVQQRAEVKKHAKTLVQLGIEHFSTYSWTIYEQDSFVEKRRAVGRWVSQQMRGLRKILMK